MTRTALRLSGYMVAALAASAALLWLTTWVSTVANAALDGPSEATIAISDSNPAGTNDFGPLAPTVGITASCRFGVYAMSEPDATYLNWIAGQPNTGIGWNVDFHLDPAVGAKIPGAEYVPMIRMLQDRDAAGNYLNSYHTYPALNDAELAPLIAKQPAALWLVGNEPDRGPVTYAFNGNRIQDDSTPEMYARMYHDAYSYIKGRDPKAQVAIAGLVEVTPGRLQYLDKVWAQYQALYGTTMPVDVWNMHTYYLPEVNENHEPIDIASIAIGTDPLLGKIFAGGNFVGNAAKCSDSRYICFAQHDSFVAFQGEVVALRTWMKNHGQQNKPLIITEMGQLYPCNGCTDPVSGAGCNVLSPQDEFGNCFTWTRTTNFLNATFGYMDTAADANLGYPMDHNRLVQQWLWFAVQPNGFPNATLVTGTNPISFNMIGNAFKTFAQNSPQTINLIANSNRLYGLNLSGGSQMTVTIEVGIYNNGTIMPGSLTPVTLYSDVGRTVPVATGFLTEARGCGRKETRAYVSLVLPVSTTTIHYYGRVDPGNAAGETTMGDNDFEVNFTVTPSRLLLPLIRR